jgi:hypothetical protein
MLDSEKMQRYATEERNIREENLRLQRKLQLEMDRREALCRHLSESESSLEMEEERHYNEAIIGGVAPGTSSTAPPGVRPRRVSSPVPYPSPSSSRPLSPGEISLILQWKAIDVRIFRGFRYWWPKQLWKMLRVRHTVSLPTQRHSLIVPSSSP